MLRVIIIKPTINIRYGDICLLEFNCRGLPWLWFIVKFGMTFYEHFKEYFSFAYFYFLALIFC